MKKVYLEITMNVADKDRGAAGAVYAKYRMPFLNDVKGALSKELLVRDQDVQVLHGFDNEKNAFDYLNSDLFNKDVVTELSPLLKGSPEIRVYSIA